MTVSEKYDRLTPENRRIVNAMIDELVKQQARKETQNEDHDLRQTEGGEQ